jgi:hypothetical protein
VRVSLRLDLRNDKERLARWPVIVVSLPQIKPPSTRRAAFIKQRKKGRVAKADRPFPRLSRARGLQMKRFYVEQLGNVQVEAARSFIVEVPDDFTEEQAQELLRDFDRQLPGTEGMEWRGDDDRDWVGFDVDVLETDIYDADNVKTEGLEVIRLADLIDGSGAGM